MKKHMVILAAVAAPFWITFIWAGPAPKQPWIPPITAATAPLGSKIALWPTAHTNMVLPRIISVHQRGGAVSMVYAEYLATEVTFEAVRDAVDAKFKKYRTPQKDSWACVWMIRDKSVMISLLGSKGHVTLDIQPIKSPAWLAPLKK